MNISPIEEKICNIALHALNNLGYNIVQAKLTGLKPQRLEILIEKLDGSNVTVSDCRTASKNISTLLDVEDVISDKYFLEVSSAGIERPLVTLEDFSKFAGKEISLKLYKALNDKKKFQGKLEGVEEENVILNVNNEKIKLAYADIKGANIVFTDEMFKESLKKGTN